MIHYCDYEPFDTFPEYLRTLESRYGEAVALRERDGDGWAAYSYARLGADVRKAASCLDLRGKHVAVIGGASYLWIVSALAVLCAGGVLVPLNKDMEPDEMRLHLQKSGAQLAILSDEYGDRKEALSAAATVLLLSEVERLLGGCAQGGALPPAPPPETLAAILFTSGTTGTPKGVMHTHGNIVAMIKSAAQIADFHGRLLYLIPVHHILGFEITILTYLLAGAELYLNDSLQHLMKNIADARPTEILIVPALMEGFYNMCRGDLSKMRAGLGGQVERLISGGAPLSDYLVEEITQKAGIAVVNGYGLTECTPVSVNGVVGFMPGSIGYHSEFCEYAVAEDGEILVSGQILSPGYYNDPAATREAFFEKDGVRWFKTGDLGHIDDNGFLYIVGRKKNLIILSNGENVAPEELEALIKNRLHYAKEVMVYAEDGQIVAEVFPDPDAAPRPAAVIEEILALNGELIFYKRFGKALVRDTEFPKNAMKKMIRKAEGG